MANIPAIPRTTITTVHGVTTVTPDYEFDAPLRDVLRSFGMPTTATAMMRVVDRVGAYEMTTWPGPVTVRMPDLMPNLEASASAIPEAFAWFFVEWARRELAARPPDWPKYSTNVPPCPIRALDEGGA